MLLRRLICLLLCFQIASSKAAEANSPDEDSEARERAALTDLLVEPLPENRTGAYFEYLFQDKLDRYRDWMERDPDPRVQALAHLGLEYFRTYYQQLERDFSVSSLALLLKRESEILRRLAAFRHPNARQRAERPLDKFTAATWAWRDTLTQLGLPSSWSRDQVERYRRVIEADLLSARSQVRMLEKKLQDPDQDQDQNSIRAEWAAQKTKIEELRQELLRVEDLDRVYDLLYFQYQDRIEPQPTEKEDDRVSEFKNQVSGALVHARIENFRAAAHLASPQARWRVHLKDSFEVSAQDLAQAQFTFALEPLRRSTRVVRTDGTSIREQVQSWVDWYREGGWKREERWRERLVRVFFERPEYKPAWAAYRVKVTLSNGREWSFSESEFNALLHDFRIYPHENPFAEQRELRSYLAEAARRDQILSDMNFSLIHTNDLTLDELETRLRVFTRNTAPTGYRGGVEDLIHRHGESVVENSRTAQLYLAGYMIHPRFWEQKAQLAVMMPHNPAAPVYQIEPRLKYDSPPERIARARIFMRQHLTEWFYDELGAPGESASAPPVEINQEQSRPSGWWAWVYSWIRPSQRQNPSIAKSQNSGSGASPKGKVREPRARAQILWRNILLATAAAAGLNYMSDGWIHEQFWSAVGGVPDWMPQLDVGIGDPSRLDSFNKRTGSYNTEDLREQIAFRILVRQPHAPPLEYFNLAANFNLPFEVLRDIDPRSEPPLVHRVPLGPIETPALVVESLLTSKPDRGRIAIVHIPGYELAYVELRDWRSRPVDPGEFAVYKVPATGLTYAELADPSWGFWSRYTYVAAYRVKDGSGPPMDPVFADMDRTALSKALSLMRESGLYEPAAAIQKRISSGGTLSAPEFAGILSESAIYSSRPPNALKRELRGNPFYLSSQYAHQGRPYYQCTGSTELTASAFDVYFEELKVEYRNDLFVQPVHGYSLASYDKDVATFTAHAHNVVGRHSIADSAIELDAQPYTQDPDPRYARPPVAAAKENTNQERPSPHSDHSEEESGRYALRPRAPKLTRDRRTPPPNSAPKSPSLLERLAQKVFPQPEKKNQPSGRAGRLRIDVVRLRSLHDRAIAALEALERREKEKRTGQLSRLDPSQIPGTEMIGYSSVILKWSKEDAQNELPLLEALLRHRSREQVKERARERIRRNDGDVSRAIGEIIIASAQSFERILHRLDEEQAKPSSSAAASNPWSFLTLAHVRETLVDLNRYLASLDWNAAAVYARRQERGGFDCGAALLAAKGTNKGVATKQND
ncbi:MAG: hypothetical protein AB7G93_04525 [Bdellovibrionales bacterium]